MVNSKVVSDKKIDGNGNIAIVIYDRRTRKTKKHIYSLKLRFDPNFSIFSNIEYA